MFRSLELQYGSFTAQVLVISNSSPSVFGGFYFGIYLGLLFLQASLLALGSPLME